jgi:hypothetical protein
MMRAGSPTVWASTAVNIRLSLILLPPVPHGTDRAGTTRPGKSSAVSYTSGKRMLWYQIYPIPGREATTTPLLAWWVTPITVELSPSQVSSGREASRSGHDGPALIEVNPISCP